MAFSTLLTIFLLPLIVVWIFRHEGIARRSVLEHAMVPRYRAALRAVIRWRFNFGDGGSVRGVNLLRVRDGRIVEALGYAKSPGQSAPLPE